MSTSRASQLVEAGVWLEATGDHDSARRMYEQALRLDPGNAQARQAMERQRARLAGSGLPPPAAPTPPREPEPAVPAPHRARPDLDIDWGSRVEEAERKEPPPAPPGLRSKKSLPGAPSRARWVSHAGSGQDLGTPVPPPPGVGIGRDVIDVLSDPPPRATPPPIARPDDLRQEMEALIRGAQDLLALDDHSGAMDLIRKASELSPEDPVVQRLKEKSEIVLLSMFESKLAPLHARPRLLLRPDEIIWLNLDHRAGFVLAQIDGSVSYEDLVSICGMSRLDTLRILAQLVSEGVIAAAKG